MFEGHTVDMLLKVGTTKPQVYPLRELMSAIGCYTRESLYNVVQAF